MCEKNICVILGSDHADPKLLNIEETKKKHFSYRLHLFSTKKKIHPNVKESQTIQPYEEAAEKSGQLNPYP